MTPRWMKVALIASLTVNLLVGGAVVGAVLSDRPAVAENTRSPQGRRDAGPPEIGLLARHLTREDRRALRDGLRADGGLRAGLERMRAGRAEMLEALRAQPFDPDSLRQTLAAQRATQADLAAQGVARLEEIITAMTDAERAAFADRLEKAMSRLPRNGTR